MGQYTSGLDAPFTYFGGKSDVADEVWSRFDSTEIRNYLEPFAGSCAVLLKRPHVQGAETINDVNGYVCNFWRAVAQDPDTVASYCEWPAIENDLHARKDWLMDRKEDLTDQLRDDPEWYDAKAAAWWCWGSCNWIGKEWPKDTQQKPKLSSRAGEGVMSADLRDSLNEELRKLGDRLRHVRVLCGDWHRTVSSDSMVLSPGTPCAVFLDPPYPTETVYDEDSNTLYREVEEWCLEYEDRDDIRIALCGYTDTYDRLSDDWDRYVWSRVGGYGNQGGGDNEDRHRECIYFSPSCKHADKSRRNRDQHDDVLDAVGLQSS